MAAISLNTAGKSNASSLISAGKVDKTSDWSFSGDDGNAILGSDNDWSNYTKWFLGVDTSATEKTKAYYKYPFGKGGKVYRSGVIAAESRAAAQGDTAVENAASSLLEAIDGKKTAMASVTKFTGDLKPVFKTVELQRAADSPDDNPSYTFVASDETPDRYGDIVRAAGWQLANYKRNPIVLFQHQNSNPVGISTKIWIAGTTLMATIKLAAAGTSPFIDTLRSLLAQGIVKAVSVGFMPLAAPNYLRDKEQQVTGMEFVSQELYEISLVSVPANPAALQEAKALHIPEAHMQRVFAPRPVDALVQGRLREAQMEIIRLGVSGTVVK